MSATKCKVILPETTHLYVESPPGLLSKAKDIPDVQSAFRERLGRPAFPPVIALRASVAQKPQTLLVFVCREWLFRHGVTYNLTPYPMCV